MRYLLLSLVALCGVSFATVTHAAMYDWPASSGVSIGGSLAATAPPSGNVFEPSDAAIAGDKLLLVSDEGDVATMDFEGNNVATWLTWAGNDMEGATIVGDVLYVLNERYRDVYAYDLTTHALLRTYDLSPWIPGFDNEGPEALVYHDGQWLVGHSVTEEILAFDLSGDAPLFLESWNSGLHVRALHSGEDGKLYVMSSGRVAVFDEQGGMVDYSLPTGPTGPEGFAMSMNCATGEATAFIAYDSGSVYRYDHFPVACPASSPASEPEPVPEPTVIDADGDGVAAEDDCNDSDAAVAALQTYYRDADGDTLGYAAASVAVCSAVAPLGYVTNTSDANDAQAYFSAVGAVNGAIVVTYGNGSTMTFRIFPEMTRRLTKVSPYKDAAYLIVTSGSGKTVAVVNPYTGSIVALRAKPKTTAELNRWLVSVIGY